MTVPDNSLQKQLAAKKDSPINRATVADLSDDEMDRWVMERRERRLHAAIVYQEGQQRIKETKCEKLKTTLTKQFEMLGKEMDSLDKLLEKIDKRVARFRAMKFELTELEG
jgi:polyribonucleotide nucleotidyltransferase